jgi:hypothetical protein
MQGYENQFTMEIRVADGIFALYSGVILSAAVFQAERRISRYDAAFYGRSLGPLVKRGHFGMTPVRSSN